MHDLGRRAEELHASEHQLKEKNELVRRLRIRLRETLDMDHEQVDGDSIGIFLSLKNDFQKIALWRAIRDMKAEAQQVAQQVNTEMTAMRTHLANTQTKIVSLLEQAESSKANQSTTAHDEFVVELC